MVRIATILRLGLGPWLGFWLVASPVMADDAMRIEVAVGETLERDVGFAMGLQCDDVAIIRVELRAGTTESNTFAVTGVTEGVTKCRVGTSVNRPSYLFEVHVVVQRRRR